MLKVSKCSSDKALRMHAKKILLLRLKQEHDFGILQLLTSSIPKEPSNRLAWALEAKTYAFAPRLEKRTEEDERTLRAPSKKLLHACYLQCQSHLPPQLWKFYLKRQLQQS